MNAHFDGLNDLILQAQHDEACPGGFGFGQRG
jgi:hypothetical protein